MKQTILAKSAGGIIYSGGKVLAIRAVPQNEISFPKGTMEPGETPEQTAVREIAEETGYRGVIKAPLGTMTYEFDGDDGGHYRKTVFYYLLELEDVALEPTPNRMEGEDLENVWLTPEEAFDCLTHQESKEMLQKVLDLQL